MSRSHTLVELRLAEHQLATMLVALSKKKDQPDYLLDIEFQTQLKALMIEFGYTTPQVVKLLSARDKFTQRGVNPLLDLIPNEAAENTLVDAAEPAQKKVSKNARSQACESFCA
ncbi:hypothetical protein RYA05_33640 [Pseudomonas syringae pv. actinidiae]|nr:hypothetical protein [Pseudomonas syringae]EPM67563.1 hypothetical protein A3SM_30697 [Pseudomonas syringae pv. actinidiae ICMP 18886]EPN66976.1 hypothetical protein A234_30925 [Pseudomonas syringae pv. actinidiae ICMP 19101]EPN70321.1 hypothetical protein A235_04223 [Pseudomonas syringae pv. actinidiae ICMP 19079]AKT30812.1 hypothetical protein IYO_015060 [Pseudomonas syringae pv. actinidiae ICMP 18884]AOE57223.1 hypothetical protein NZ708_15045 [Pseudomonas syringae pv. actinidiae ICMP 18